jgi:hypothetical protein
LQLYLGAGFSTTSAGVAATTAATQSLVGFALPLSIAELVNQDVDEPIVTRLQEELNLETAMTTIDTQAVTWMFAMANDSQTAVNINNGANIFYAAADISSFYYNWTSVDQELIQREWLKCFVESTACSNQESVDQSLGSQAISNAWQVYQFDNQASSAASSIASSQ